MSKTHFRKLQKTNAPAPERRRARTGGRMLGVAVPLAAGLAISTLCGGCSEEHRYFDVGNRGAELQKATKSFEEKNENAEKRLQELAAEKKSLEKKIEHAEAKLERVEEMQEQVEESRERNQEAFQEYAEAARELLEASEQLETDSQH
ncbi:hypothetical protein GF415_02660 [Candidatus Micrarchaeota archaeon]|nr:hypothetical protein [Candidatus Micrarchaeota archaeon]